MNLKKVIMGLSAALVISIGIVVTISNRTIRPTTNEEMASTTAMITNMRGNSGGTGVVLRSSTLSSTVLTNAHVCGVIKNGGIVSTDKKSATVSFYKVSPTHDLCLVTVNTDLEIETKVAPTAPKLYSNAAVSGHPRLLPTIITRGIFSNKQVIDVLIGMRECTKEELESELGGICILLGAIPDVKTYESQVISALIQPGSSGSAVFNDNGEISGLVFAGNGQFSYGYVVPLEYIRYFLEVELRGIKAQRPAQQTSTLIESERKFKNICTSEQQSSEYSLVKNYCKYLNLDVIYQ